MTSAARPPTTTKIPNAALRSLLCVMPRTQLGLSYFALAALRDWRYGPASIGPGLAGWLGPAPIPGTTFQTGL